MLFNVKQPQSILGYFKCIVGIKFNEGIQYPMGSSSILGDTDRSLKFSPFAYQPRFHCVLIVKRSVKINVYSPVAFRFHNDEGLNFSKREG